MVTAATPPPLEEHGERTWVAVVAAASQGFLSVSSGTNPRRDLTVRREMTDHEVEETVMVTVLGNATETSMTGCLRAVHQANFLKALCHALTGALSRQDHS